jgi:ABC-type phosphate transport system substrate-binding protein
MVALQALALLLLLALSGSSPDKAPVAYRVIVNRANPANVVDRTFLREAFLKKTVRWGHGEGIRPVDLGSSSPVREKFSEEVLGRSVLAIRNYWQQLIFAGRGVPPVELEDAESVVRYVQKYPGAVGYVAGDTELAGVKAVTVR